MSDADIGAIIRLGCMIACFAMYTHALLRLCLLDVQLEKSQQETENAMALAKEYLDRAHKAEEELEALKPEINDWFLGAVGPQKSPSSVPAIEAQRRQVAAELEESR